MLSAAMGYADRCAIRERLAVRFRELHRLRRGKFRAVRRRTLHPFGIRRCPQGVPIRQANQQLPRSPAQRLQSVQHQQLPLTLALHGPTGSRSRSTYRPSLPYPLVPAMRGQPWRDRWHLDCRAAWRHVEFAAATNVICPAVRRLAAVRAAQWQAAQLAVGAAVILLRPSAKYRRQALQVKQRRQQSPRSQQRLQWRRQPRSRQRWAAH